MSPLPSIPATLGQTLVAAGMAALATAALGAAARSPAMRELCAKFRRMSRIGQAVALAVVVCLVAYSGTKPGAPQLRGGITPPSANTFSSVEQQTGYALSSIGTNETHDFTMPEGALLAERIARRGAHDDGFWLHDSFTSRLGLEGLPIENPAWVHTDGTVSFPRRVGGFFLEGCPTNTAHSNTVVYAPLQGSYGFLPASRWPSLGVSRIWTAVSDQDSRVVTWEGALLDRDPVRPVSFQAEFFGNGDIDYRYGGFPTNGTVAGLWRNGAPLVFGFAPGTAPTTLRLSYIGDLGDGAGDTDGDGLSDWEEVMALHTDPRDADTDGDGLSDGAEAAAGADPRDFDTDQDGLADGIDPNPLVSCGTGYGQSGAWVAASFANSADILAMGYDRYLESVLAGENGGWRYRFSVTVTSLDSQGRAFIRVGGQSVIADEPGTYDFLLDVGPEYPLRVAPPEGASFDASRAMAEIVPPIQGRDGTVAVRPSGVLAAPSWAHYSAPGESHRFEGVPDGADPSGEWEWRWTCGDPGVLILSPDSRATDIVWRWTPGDYHDTWATARVNVICGSGGWAATNTAILHCGSHMQPEQSFRIDVPRAFLATNGADVVVTFHSDIPTGGTVSVADASIDSPLVEGPPWNLTIADGTRDFRATRRMRASRISNEADDIVLETALGLSDGTAGTFVSRSTAVSLEEISVPPAPDTGLVVLAGASVPMEVACLPLGADLSGARTDWFLGRRRRDSSYDPWIQVATNEAGVAWTCPFPSGGIYRVMASVSLAGERDETFFKIKSRSNLDPPAPHFEVGGHGHVGVATHQWQIQLRNVAFSHIGDTRFALETSLPSYYGFAGVGEQQWKCNAFVAFCICQAGLTVQSNQNWNGRRFPPTANDWAFGIGLGDWSPLAAGDSLEPGLVAGHPNPGGAGHCGIVDYDGWPIAAGQNEVNRRYSKFLDGTSGFNRWLEEDE